MEVSKWMQRIADCADLIDETLPGTPIVEITDDNRVLVEKHNGVIEYSDEEICAKVHYGTVTIRGKNLEFVKITREQLVISGCIESVNIRRGVN